MYTPFCVAPTGCLLGEGPVWSPTEGFLWWVDIRRAKLHRYNPVTGNARRYDLPLKASALAMWDGVLLMAGDREIGRYDPQTEAYERLCKLPDLAPGCRTNDAGIAPDGSFIVTVMDEDEAEMHGAYFRYRGGQTAERLDLPAVLVPNTIVFSPDAKTMYTCDSVEQCLVSHDYNAETGAIGPRKPFSQASHANGFPDGSAMDVEGGLWTCEWGAGRIVRRLPDGSVDQIIEIEALRPTSCAFGGARMTTLFVTTARAGLTERQFERQPMSGGLFAIDLEVPGRPVPTFKPSV